MIAEELEISLHMAFVDARQKNHQLITVEHLLLSLLDNPSAGKVLEFCNTNTDTLRERLNAFITEKVPTQENVTSGDEIKTKPTPNPTLGFQQVIQRAIIRVRANGKGTTGVTGADILLAITGEKDSEALVYLLQQDVTQINILTAMECCQ